MVNLRFTIIHFWHKCENFSSFFLESSVSNDKIGFNRIIEKQFSIIIGFVVKGV